MAFQLTKMKVELGSPIQYTLKAEYPINMNELIGEKNSNSLDWRHQVHRM